MEILGQLGAGAGAGVTAYLLWDLKLVTWFFVGIWFWGREK